MTLSKGMRVTHNGKEFEIVRDPWIDDCPRNGVNWIGQEITLAQIINKKTGKPWQAQRVFLSAELTPVSQQGA